MPELTPRDDNKKVVSEILKRVDQLIKAGEFDAARQQIDKAKDLDPKNVYIHAYEERLTALLEEIRKTQEIEAQQRSVDEERRKIEDEKKRVEEEKRRKADEARRKLEEEKRRVEEEHRRAEEARRREEEARQEAKRRAEEERRKAEEERRRAEEERRLEEEERKRHDVENIRKIEEARRKTEAERKKPEVPVHEPPPVKKGQPSISWQALEETKRRILSERRKHGTELLKVSEATKKFDTAYEEGVDMYRRMLMDAWADGATSSEEEAQLKDVRTALMISDRDHEGLERDAKLLCYTQAFRRAWSSGTISPEHASSLADLRKKFRIKLEEHEEIEAQLLWELRGSSQKAVILLIDDDAKLLKVVAATLEDAGLQTKGFTTSDEAFIFLKENTPDLIISDINLETSTMGGFSFYEKVREIDRLQQIPFIFLSGLTDEVLIRTGKELGVDDYITKPFSNETLIATIKGRLKRYRQLKKEKKKS